MSNSNDMGPNCIAAQEARGDFWDMLEDAMEHCGGNRNLVLGTSKLQQSLAKLSGKPFKPLAEMPLREVVDILAQNGIRMVYLPEKHMDAPKVGTQG